MKIKHLPKEYSFALATVAILLSAYMYKLTTCSLLTFQNFKAQALQMRTRAGYLK